MDGGSTKMWLVRVLAGGLLVLGFLPARADENAARRNRGQTLYVPAYSHILHGDRGSPFYLSITLCVRNVDPAHTITLVSVDYFDCNGRRVRRYLEQPEPLKPLSSREFTVRESDKSGGVGAGFVLRWKASQPVLSPLAETVMIGTAASQGISFTGRARVMEEEGLE